MMYGLWDMNITWDMIYRVMVHETWTLADLITDFPRWTKGQGHNLLDKYSRWIEIFLKDCYITFAVCTLYTYSGISQEQTPIKTKKICFAFLQRSVDVNFLYI